MRYTGSKCRLCRREGVQLFLKGDRCKTQKCSALRKNYPPGMHGKIFGKRSEYGKQLREKQKTKRIYGITEKMMQKYYNKAQKRSGNASDNLLRLLALRFDNVVYLSGFAKSRSMARQLISHGFFTINGKRSDTASIQLRQGDKISFKSGKSENPVEELKKQNLKFPRWLKVDLKNIHCEVLEEPENKDFEKNIDTQLIIGFYSR